MSNGLYSGVSGLALGTGLYRNVSGLWGGASGLINNFAGISTPTLAMDFLAGTYSVAGTSYTFSQLVDFTRTTSGTYVNSAGLVTTTPASTNILLYTEVLDNATWTKTATVTADQLVSPDGITNADLVSTTANFQYVRQSITATASAAYTVSFYVKPVSGSTIVRVMLANGPQTEIAGSNFDLTGAGSLGTLFQVGTGVVTSRTVTQLSNGWYRCTVSGTVNTTTLYGLIDNHSNGTMSFGVWGAQLEAGSSVTTYTKNYGGRYPARFDYNPVTLQPRGFLIEPASTNSLIYSEDFTNAAWFLDNSGGSNPVVTGNAGVAPDGATTADRVVLNRGAGTFSRIYQNSTSVAGTTYTFSVWMKTYSGGTANVGIRLDSTGANCAVTGTWQRFTISAAASTTTLGSQILSFNAIPGTDVSADILVWGAQTEALTYVTSYIPTVASTVTRAADNATIQTPIFDLWYNTAAATFAFQLDIGTTSATNPLIHDTNDGTSNNRITSSIAVAGTSLSNSITTGGASQFSAGASLTFTQNTVIKTALAATTNSAIAATNGALSAQDTSVTMPVVNAIQLGRSRFNTNYIAGHLQVFDYWNTRLTNSQLQTLTA